MLPDIMTPDAEPPQKYTADAIQWMHFSVSPAGRSLEDLQQTLDGKPGILGKPLIEALEELFGSKEDTDNLGRELVIFDAEQEDAWITGQAHYFVRADEVTVELRFAAWQVWKALIGSLLMADPEEADEWFSLPANQESWQILRNCQTYKNNPIETGYRLLELLVRGVPRHQGPVKRVEVQRLLDACRQGDREAAGKLEVLAWEVENVNLWRYAMALVDGKDYLARMFAERILF
jgi:hypothetical protein